MSFECLTTKLSLVWLSLGVICPWHGHIAFELRSNPSIHPDMLCPLFKLSPNSIAYPSSPILCSELCEGECVCRCFCVDRNEVSKSNFRWNKDCVYIEGVLFTWVKPNKIEYKTFSSAIRKRFSPLIGNLLVCLGSLG